MSDIQPDSIEIKLCDGLFVKSMHFAHKHTVAPQHSHRTQHLSMIATGSVRIWADGVLLGDFQAPKGVLIEAKVKHRFLTLEDSTLIYCIHNADCMEIDEEHELTEADLIL